MTIMNWKTLDVLNMSIDKSDRQVSYSYYEETIKSINPNLIQNGQSIIYITDYTTDSYAISHRVIGGNGQTCLANATGGYWKHYPAPGQVYDFTDTKIRKASFRDSMANKDIDVKGKIVTVLEVALNGQLGALPFHPVGHLKIEIASPEEKANYVPRLTGLPEDLRGRLYSAFYHKNDESTETYLGIWQEVLAWVKDNQSRDLTDLIPCDYSNNTFFLWSVKEDTRARARMEESDRLYKLYMTDDGTWCENYAKYEMALREFETKLDKAV